MRASTFIVFFLSCFQRLRSAGPQRWQNWQSAPARQKPRLAKSHGLHVPVPCPAEPCEGQASEPISSRAPPSTKEAKRTTWGGGPSPCVGGAASDKVLSKQMRTGAGEEAASSGKHASRVGDAARIGVSSSVSSATLPGSKDCGEALVEQPLASLGRAAAAPTEKVANFWALGASFDEDGGEGATPDAEPRGGEVSKFGSCGPVDDRKLLSSGCGCCRGTRSSVGGCVDNPSLGVHRCSLCRCMRSCNSDKMRCSSVAASDAAAMADFSAACVKH